jgi:hypothetical protein
MNVEACTPEMLREEADHMHGGSLEKLRAFIEGRYKERAWGAATLHLEEDLVTLERMINGDPV